MYDRKPIEVPKSKKLTNCVYSLTFEISRKDHIDHKFKSVCLYICTAV